MAAEKLKNDYKAQKQNLDQTTTSSLTMSQTQHKKHASVLILPYYTHLLSQQTETLTSVTHNPNTAVLQANIMQAI
jgi:hypothetical protein